MSRAISAFVTVSLQPSMPWCVVVSLPAQCCLTPSPKCCVVLERLVFCFVVRWRSLNSPLGTNRTSRSQMLDESSAVVEIKFATQPRPQLEWPSLKCRNDLLSRHTDLEKKKRKCRNSHGKLLCFHEERQWLRSAQTLALPIARSL